MNLGDLITRLEAADPNQVVRHGFHNPHSYRGYYMDLAFEPAENITVGEILEAARSAVGATYEGWKGGQFKMNKHDWCWLSEEGTASGETISALLVDLMLAPPADDVLPIWEAVYEPGNVSDYLIGYTNDEAPAKAAAEAWLRFQKDETGRLEWVPEEKLATGHYDRWFELLEHAGDGIPTGPGLIVRRRAAEEA